MQTDLIKINPQDFGLEETKAQDIANQFKPMLDKMVELEKEFNEIVSLPIEEVSTHLKAKELRLKYVKVRTGTAAIHKTQKEFYLAGGRYVDGWKNAQLFASQGKEKALEEIEKYAEKMEQKRIQELQEKRVLELTPYEVENIQLLELGKMSEEVWQNFLKGTIVNYNAKKEAERIAKEEEERRIFLDELERKRSFELAPFVQFINENSDLRNMSEEDFNSLLKSVKEAKLEYEKEQERIRLENEKLKKEAEEKERQLAEERAKAEAERKAIEEKARQEREEKERLEAQIKAEREAKEKAEREEAKRLEEERKEKERAEKKAKAAPDKEKIIVFKSYLLALPQPELKTMEAVLIMDDVNSLIQKIAKFIDEKTQEL